MSLIHRLTFRVVLSLWLLGSCFSFSQAQAPSQKTWVAKVNLLSPIANNFSGELEYMPWSRVSLFAGGGVDKGFEALRYTKVASCTKDRGYGFYLGGKYMLKVTRTSTRGVDGLGIKGFMGYQITDQLSQTCPSLLPWYLEKRKALSLNTAISYQKTFWNRLFLEAQVGLGVGVEQVTFENPDWIGLPVYENPFYLSVPLGLHVGFMF